MTAAIELETFLAHLSRPGAAPAPTRSGVETGPGTSDSRPGPRVTEKACGCGVLDGEDCDCAEFTAQAMAAFRRPIFFDYRKPEAA
ncbi:hypothetical protein GAR05_06115 [Micromonospora saelicesensis]|uniref:Uncharacterized protein n=1 Tax=Micromonospora saelicesensis TaxID=285676 RepID=A0ABX9CBB1_9ACTN|nr:hypothetical protein [Micromonospora saelicesensis]RAN92623.1 hypothetical protein GAR05_06115 [Micromonospora saelicesensis]